MPHTVPNRPTNGAVAPMVASRPVPRVMRRPAAASMRLSEMATRSLMPSAGSAPERPSSRSVVRTIAPVAPETSPMPARAASSEALPSRMRSWRRSLPATTSSSSDFASHTVQVTTEAKARPIITPFTIQSAAMNIPQGERSCGSVALTAASSVGVTSCGASAAGVLGRPGSGLRHRCRRLRGRGRGEQLRRRGRGVGAGAAVAAGGALSCAKAGAGRARASAASSAGRRERSERWRSVGMRLPGLRRPAEGSCIPHGIGKPVDYLVSRFNKPGSTGATT